MSVRLRVSVILLGIAGFLILIVVTRIDSCLQRRQEQKIERLRDEIIRRDVEIRLSENRVEEAVQYANKSNQNADNVLNHDSNSRNSDFGTVRKRWCSEHPADSKCRK